MVYTLGGIGNVPGQAFDFLKRQAGRFVNLTKPGADDGDYTTRSAAIARQKKLADMLSQMGEQEQAVSTAGGITAPMSGMGALARGLTSFGGAYLSGKASADEAALEKGEKAAISSGFADILKRGDIPASQGAQLPDDESGIEQYAVNPAQKGKGKYVLTPDEQQEALIKLVNERPGAAGVASSYFSLIENARKRNEPVYRAKTEYGGDLVNSSTQEIIQSFPSNEKPRVPGHMTLGNRVYAINPDGTAGADLGPAPTGGGTKVDITIPQGPDATAVREANQAASTNRNMEANYGLMIDMLPNIKTGSTVPLEIGAKAALQSLGISAPTVELGTQQAFRALSNQAALYLRNPASGMGLTGNTSDRDLTFLKEGGPGIAQSPFANEAVLLIARAKSRRNAELAELEMDHLTTQGNYKGWAKVKKDYVNSNSLFTPSEQARWSQFTPKRGGAGGQTPTAAVAAPSADRAAADAILNPNRPQ